MVISLLEKSAPMVGLKFSVNLLCSNIWIRLVFPTPESPIATILTKHFLSELETGIRYTYGGELALEVSKSYGDPRGRDARS